MLRLKVKVKIGLLHIFISGGDAVSAVIVFMLCLLNMFLMNPLHIPATVLKKKYGRVI